MSTKERLAEALSSANAPDWMITKARDGHYDDFESDSATPIVDLVTDCRRFNLSEVERRAINGDFDSTKEEAEQWFEREGQYLL